MYNGRYCLSSKWHSQLGDSPACHIENTIPELALEAHFITCRHVTLKFSLPPDHEFPVQPLAQPEILRIIQPFTPGYTEKKNAFEYSPPLHNLE
jgi:hypothetical protein